MSQSSPTGACDSEETEISSTTPVQYDSSITIMGDDATASKVLTEDASTQCCVGARFVITRSVSTQTPGPIVSTPAPVKTCTDIGIQVDRLNEFTDGAMSCPSQGSGKPYHSGNQNDTNLSTINHAKPGKRKRKSRDNYNNDSKQHKPTLFELVYPSDEESPNDPPLSPLAMGDESYDNDDDYKNEMSDNAGSSPDNSDVELESDEHNERKFIVFESCLKLLLTICSICGAAICEWKEKTSGTMLSVTMTCINSHLTCWSSQPLIKNIAAGNLLSSAAILFSANTFSRISQFASFLDLKFFSHTTYYNIQNKYLFPVVNKAWEEERMSTLDAIKRDGPVNLIGDGRCDSPGHSAKYCTYTMMTDEGKVAAFNVVQVTEVTSSNAMEKEGFERCIQDLSRERVTVKRIATDRHTSIACAMKKDHSEVSHQYDVWHLSKWIFKQLTKKAKVRGCEDLVPWIRSVSNHL